MNSHLKTYNKRKHVISVKRSLVKYFAHLKIPLRSFRNMYSDGEKKVYSLKNKTGETI